jgi:hypothetical protein
MGLLSINSITFTRSTVQAPSNDTGLKLDREKHVRSHVARQGLLFLGTVLDPITNDTVFSGRCIACHPLNSASNDLIFDPDDDQGIGIPLLIQVSFDPNPHTNQPPRDKEYCACTI